MPVNAAFEDRLSLGKAAAQLQEGRKGHIEQRKILTNVMSLQNKASGECATRRRD